MGSYDNAEIRRGESVKQMMESVEAESMSGVLIDYGEAGAKAESSLRMTAAGSMKKRNGVAPGLGRTKSGTARGFKGIRFLERSATGKEADAWKTIERRFDQNAEGERLYRDKFGACIGMFLQFFSSASIVA